MSSHDLFAAAAFLLLGHAYIGYPLSLLAAAELKKRRSRATQAAEEGSSDQRQLPAVSIIIAAYNEEAVLEEKLENCRNLHYPADKLEILIGSDGSSDNTAQILRNHPEIRSFIFDQNRGKAAVLNDLITEANHPILLFSDANTMLLPNAVQELASCFDDPKVGVVSGRLLLQSSDPNATLSYGESLYWGVETTIKLLESEWGAVMGANGALYALRKEGAATLPVDQTVMDDFFMTAQMLRHGWKSLIHPRAIGLEQTSSEQTGEFRRKIRIGRANLNYLTRFLPLLNPLRPLVAYSFISHKLLRWSSPLLLLLLLLFSTLGAAQNLLSLSALLLLGQLLFHAAALVGWRRDLQHNRSRWSQIAYYFDSMNLALLIGLFQSFRSTKGGGWERVARQGDS